MSERSLKFCAIGVVIGMALSIVGIILGIFACVPTWPFQEKNLEVCISLIVLSAIGVVAMWAGLLGACVGMFVDVIVIR